MSLELRRLIRLAATKPIPCATFVRTLLGDRTRSERQARKVRRMAGRK